MFLLILWEIEMLKRVYRIAAAVLIIVISIWIINDCSDKTNEQMIRAVSNGNTVRINKLLQRGVDVNVEDKDGWTPMHHAAKFGQLDAIKLLEKEGGDINAKDKKGNTVMHIAGLHLNFNVLRWLMEQGADVNAKNNEGKKPFDLAADESMKKNPPGVMVDTEDLIGIMNLMQDQPNGGVE